MPPGRRHLGRWGGGVFYAKCRSAHIWNYRESEFKVRPEAAKTVSRVCLRDALKYEARSITEFLQIVFIYAFSDAFGGVELDDEDRAPALSSFRIYIRVLCVSRA